MKFKFNILLISAVTGVMVCLSFSAQAQFQGDIPQGRMPQEGMPQRSMEQSNLSDDQKEKLHEIQESVHEEMADLLTDDQNQQLQSAIAAGRNPREALQSLDLDEDQETNIRELLQEAQEKMQAVLTEQ
jgi:Spy/CpxP family protein refolding chaperone